MTTHVYAISSSEQPAPVKIGKSANVNKRLSQLQTASPVPLRVWWQRETPDPELEAKLHRHFAAQRISGEWFRFEKSDWAAEIAHVAELLEVQHLQRIRPLSPDTDTATGCPTAPLNGPARALARALGAGVGIPRLRT